MTPKVSVIMAVYNAKAFLNETLDCVLNQTLREIEVICVDDGSTDESLSILNARAAKDDRMIVVSQKNATAGAARNEGMRRATGKYLSFLDADDRFERDMLEVAYETCERENAEIGVFRCDMFDDRTGIASSGAWALRDEYLPEKRPFSWRDMPDHLFFAFVGWAWDKLFLREFAVEKGLSFQALRTTNDMYFVFTALASAERIVTIDRVLAHQRRRAGDSLSVTRERSWDCFHAALEGLGEFLKARGSYPALERGYLNYCVHFSLWNLNSIFGEAYGRLYDAIRENYFPAWGIRDLPDDYFMNMGELAQARRILEMPFSTYAAHMINGARTKSGADGAARAELAAIKNSASYRIGRAITYLPRLMRKRK
jgi:glycosyltransferase involved in cell wall biosynthesis